MGCYLNNKRGLSFHQKNLSTNLENESLMGNVGSGFREKVLFYQPFVDLRQGC
jgi:hypothetical protein